MYLLLYFYKYKHIRYYKNFLSTFPLDRVIAMRHPVQKYWLRTLLCFQVREEESSEYAKYRVQGRDEGMMLYGPIPQTRQRNVNILMNKKTFRITFNAVNDFKRIG